jgi:cyclomaltodextrinase / maltogenic alpha-amylase / neopullulanase
MMPENGEGRRLAGGAMAVAGVTVLLLGGLLPCQATDQAAPHVPEWVADAVFYQVFPERFANGDPTNDPTRESLEAPVPESWEVSPWTGDWYARADWERELGPDFFEHGVFHRRYGGDLQGVIDRLDYLQDLGITAIYLNPVFEARSLHKYDGNSFHHVDRHFGPDPEGDLAIMAAETADPQTWTWTAADRLFLDLLREAHARGMRVVIDGVFNHTGRDFFAFDDVRKRGRASPYADWYTIIQEDDPATAESEFRYQCWWGIDTLPEFADTPDGKDLGPGPKAYILDITRRWMDPDGDGNPADGIDGWRLDVAREVPVAFWRDWHAVVQSLNPEAYTVAEEWDEASRFLGNAAFDATMNYFGFSFPVKGYLIDGTLPATQAVEEFRDRLADHPAAMRYAMLNLVDGHDTDRVASMIVNAGRRPYEQPQRFDFDVAVSPRHHADYDLRRPNDRERRIQRMVALLQLTYLGSPMIYYGTEAGMWGADDPCDRMPMVWPGMEFESQVADPRGRARQAEPVAFDQATFAFFRAAIELRKKFPCLRHGAIEFLPADDETGFLAYERNDDNDRLLVGFNRGEAAYAWRIPNSDGSKVTQVFTASGDARHVTIANDGDSTVVTLPALEAVVLRVGSTD